MYNILKQDWATLRKIKIPSASRARLMSGWIPVCFIAYPQQTAP